VKILNLKILRSVNKQALQLLRGIIIKIKRKFFHSGDSESPLTMEYTNTVNQILNCFLEIFNCAFDCLV